MKTKEQLISLLEANEGSYLSGNEIAERLGITRAGVWKAIQQLTDDGYDIEAVKNRGYKLGDRNDSVTEGKIRTYLGDYADKYTLDVRDTITSTNTVMKETADKLPTWQVIISGMQTAGRGRIGRSFFSPSASGVYISVLLRPTLPAAEATKITTAAAVAACKAMEECTDAEPKIKWVNDVFVRGLKVCGILTEGSFNMETGGLDWAVMGIGLNVYEPETGFPEELRGIAGPIALAKEKDLRSKLAASFLRYFYDLCSDLGGASFTEEYRSRSFLIGKKINVLRLDSSRPATALAIDDECRLLVRYEDGTEEALSTGEVSVRPVEKE